MRFSCMFVLIVLSAPSLLSDVPPPFVAGFERFARHGIIGARDGGRLLLSELSCTSCHESGASDLDPKLGPRLDGVGNRVRAEWLRRFLAAPHDIKPGTTMPDVLGSFAAARREHAIEALVAFLSTLRTPFPVVKAGGNNPVPHEFWRHGDPKRGRSLYHQVGCVACHEPDASFSAGTTASELDRLLEQLSPAELESMGIRTRARAVVSVPHGDIASKYSARSLTFFLMDPSATRPGGRMPSFRLAAVDAADIASYLLTGETEQAASTRSTLSSRHRDLIREGRRLFAELRCVSCHSAGDVSATRSSKPLGELNVASSNSCFAPAGTQNEGQPHFPLDDLQSRAVRATLGELNGSQAEERSQTVSADLDFRLLQLNCYACHERDSRGGVGRKRRQYFSTAGEVDIGDEGRLPPTLTGVGDKLQAAELARVLAGSGHVRPYVIARMPTYPKDRIESLPDLFVRSDRLSRVEASMPPMLPRDAVSRGSFEDAGRALLDVGCVQCHPVRGESLPGIVGVDLATATTRLQPHWFRQFLLDPAALKPATRMPSFFPDGKSTRADILGGDREQQIAAMWAYLSAVSHQTLPAQIIAARVQSFELLPAERPIVLRTFLRGVSTHAIAVGFPQRVHYAFDAEAVRPARAWRGRFLDAYGTWFTRAAPPAQPLGENVVDLPSGMPLAILRNEEDRWPRHAADAREAEYRFLGYRLDRTGVPTFLYRYRGFGVADRFEALEEDGLLRRIRVERNATSQPQNGNALWFRLHAGKNLRSDRPSSYTRDDGLSVTVHEATARLGIVRTIEGDADWILPLSFDREAVIELTYTW